MLARELNLEQVKRIHSAIVSEPILGPSGQPMRIEMFCHGALCLAVSGKCFMSLGTRGESANRGQCLQTCRRSYLVKDKTRDIELEVDNEYIMSPKVRIAAKAVLSVWERFMASVSDCLPRKDNRRIVY